MDPSTWLAIGLMGIAALLADIVIAYVVAGRYGPNRARTLILNDPEYKATRAELLAIQAKLDGSEARVDKALSEHLRSVEKAIAAVQVSPVVQLPQGAVQDAMVSVKASAKKIIRDAVEETLSQLQVTAPEVTPESVADSIVNQQQTEYIASLLAPYVPEQYLGMATQAAQKYGPQVLTALAERFGIELEM